MAKTRGAHSFRPRVLQGPIPTVAGPSPATTYFLAAEPTVADPTTAIPAVAGFVTANPSAAAVGADPRVPAAHPTADDASPALAVGDIEGSSSVALVQRRYHTRVGPTPPTPSHPRPACRGPPAKRARTSGPGESSTSRSKAPLYPPYQGIAGALDLSLGSIIRRPYFPCNPIPGNVSCRDRDCHGEVYYDLPAFSADPGLRKSMFLIQRYHMRVRTIILGSSPSSIIR